MAAQRPPSRASPRRRHQPHPGCQCLNSIARQHQPQRQPDPRLQSTPGPITQLNIAAMHRSDPLHDRQPQPGAFAATSAVTTGERVEDRLKLRRIDPRPTVHHTQHHIRAHWCRQTAYAATSTPLPAWFKALPIRLFNRRFIETRRSGNGWIGSRRKRTRSSLWL